MNTINKDVICDNNNIKERVVEVHSSSVFMLLKLNWNYSN